MKYSCLHTHTEFCDGNGTVEDFCQNAFEKGFVSLGFSAHAPLPKDIGTTSDWHLNADDVNIYIDAVNNAKEKWRGKLDVYLGLEVDFIRGCAGPSDNCWQKLGLDYIIGSVHRVPPLDKKNDWAKNPENKNKLLCIDGTREDFELIINKEFEGDSRALVEAYYNDLSAMCTAGGFDILGHADLIVKNNKNDIFFSTQSGWYKQCVYKLADTLAEKNNIIVEVNTGGLNRGSTTSLYPSDDILKIFMLKNIPVTINADAHSVEHLGGFYEKARVSLLASGYREYMLFNGKKNWTASVL
ncbi:MAG: histidinol-phosphatase [Spirochaetaceae bacterium]|jgi:histidinol-phosphatase (PHP family)|nr:histidinol-phosphatase [Spirochaetaceae bacterium]